jgi:hypothetical protein
MKIKTLAIALALTAAPTLAFAQGCNGSKQKQAMSCAAGSAYDSTTNTCLPTTS